MSTNTQGSGEPDDYDLAPELPRVVSAPGGDPPKAKLTLTYRGVSKSESVRQVDSEALKNLNWPLALLGIGEVVEVVGAYFIGGNFAAMAAGVGINLVLDTVVTLVAVLMAAKLRAIELGKFRYVILKLSAICIFPAAMLMVCMPVLRFIPILGALGGLVGEFVLYFALLGVFFDLDELDTWFCVAVIFLVNLGVYFLSAFLLGGR